MTEVSKDDDPMTSLQAVDEKAREAVAKALWDGQMMVLQWEAAVEIANTRPDSDYTRIVPSFRKAAERAITAYLAALPSGGEVKPVAYWALWSPSGMHIGLWTDRALAEQAAQGFSAGYRIEALSSASTVPAAKEGAKPDAGWVEWAVLERQLRALMTMIYNRGHSGLDHNCPLCQAYIAADRMLSFETGAALSEEVQAWDRNAGGAAKLLIDALQLGIDLVTKNGWGTYRRMEGSELYEDAATFERAATAAIEAATKP